MSEAPDPLNLLRDALATPPTVPILPAAPPPKVGPYVVMNHLKSGGMGSVYKAWHPELSRWVALKFLRDTMNPESLAYFQREARLAAGLDHPNIAKVFEVGEHAGAPYIAMQYVDGGNLTGFSREAPLEMKVSLVRQIAEAIQYAHDHKVIHRDLKPANVMMDREGHIYVMDFGLAKEIEFEGEHLTKTGAVLGTPSYMAPEQARGQADAASDLYGIGAILYELVTGRPPFTGVTMTDVLTQLLHDEPVRPRRLAPGLPEDLEAIILKCLEKDRKRRYSSASQLLQDLDAFQQHNPLPYARRATVSYVIGRKIRKQPLLWTFAAALVVAIPAGAVFGAYWLVRARNAAQEQARTEREGRERTEAQRKIADERTKLATQRLAAGHFLRGFKAQEAGDTALAALLLAEAYELDPTPRYRTAASLALNRSPRTVARLDHGESVKRAAFSTDGTFLATRGYKVARLWDIAAGTMVSEWKSTERLLAMGFLPDGTWRVVSSSGAAVHFWNGRTGEAAGGPMNHEGKVNDAELSPDGTCVATAGEDRTVRLWNARTGAPIGAAIHRLEPISSLEFDSGGTRLLMLSGPNYTLWDSRSGRAVGKSVPNPTPQVLGDVTLSPGGAWIAVRSPENKDVTLWNFATGEPDGDWIQLKGATQILFSPDGKMMLTFGPDGSVTRWETATRKPMGKPLRPPLTGRGHRFDPKASFVLAYENRCFWIWDAATGDTVVQWSFRGDYVGANDFSSDGLRVVAAGDDGVVEVWDIRESLVNRLALAHPSYISKIFVALDGRTLITHCGDSKIRIWELGVGDPAVRILETGGRVDQIAMRPDGKRLVTAAWDRDVRMWEIEPGRPAVERTEKEKRLFPVAFSRDGKFVAMAVDKGTVRVWNAETDKPVGRAMKLEGKIDSLAFSGDASRLLVGVWKGPVCLWNVETGEPVGRAWRDAGKDFIAFLSADGRRVALVFEDYSTRVWDVDADKPVGGTLRFGAGSFGIHLSPDGRRILVMGQDGAFQIWDVETATAVGKAMRHELFTPCFSLSPSERMFATACRYQARLWDAETGELIGSPLHLGTQNLKGIAFMGAGEGLIIGGEDGVVRVWNFDLLPQGKAIDASRRAAQTRTGLRLDSRDELQPIPADEWGRLRLEADPK